MDIKKQLLLPGSLLLLPLLSNASIEVYNQEGHKVMLNGRVKAANYIGDTDNTVDKEGDNTTARLGFTGETRVTDKLSGYGRVEWETYTGKDSFKETRYGFAGLRYGELGSIDYGRNDYIVKRINSYTDMFPEFGGDANSSTYYLGKRVSGALTYYNHDFFGLLDNLNFGLQYVDTTSRYDESYGGSLEYTFFDALTLGGAFILSSGEKEMRTWVIGAQYRLADLYLAALYINKTENRANQPDEDISGYELALEYYIDTPIGVFAPSIGYVDHKDRSSGQRNGDVINYFNVGITHDFNKNLQGIIDYKFNLLDKDDRGAHGVNGNSKDTLALVLIYQF